MLIRNRYSLGILKMNEISGNVIDMEKEQLKTALQTLSKMYNVSPSELGQKAGIAPSTITGFINDVPGRGHYGLSAKTQSILAETYPEFKNMIEKPIVSNHQYNMPIIGMWHTDYRVLGLELGMAATFTCNWYDGVESVSAVVRSPDFFKRNLSKNNDIIRQSYPDNVSEIRYYLFQNSYADNLDEVNSKQVYATCENGNFMGYSVKVKDKYFLFNFYGQQIKIAGEVLKASIFEWTRQI